MSPWLLLGVPFVFSAGFVAGAAWAAGYLCPR